MEVAAKAIAAYARAYWQASRVTPEVFWRDLLQWCVMASNYGLLRRSEIDILRRAAVKSDLDLADAILAEFTTTPTPG